ncbi:MAG: ribosome biogenesis GTP-binding protein YihA/YsxC [Rhodospirillales bacterium]
MPLARADADAVEAGRRLFARACEFIAAAPTLAAMPPPALPEVAFAGRSNVGKSSLVNALTGRRTLARTSHTPGRTQALIFFDLGDALTLVDMPGYGYAQAPKKLVETWSQLVRDYLRGRPSLRRLCLLVDSRHGIKDNDRELMDLLDEAALSFQVVLTKCDKTAGPALEHLVAAVDAEIGRRPAAHPEVVATSSRTGFGVEVLRAGLAALAAPAQIG